MAETLFLSLRSKVTIVHVQMANTPESFCLSSILVICILISEGIHVPSLLRVILRVSIIKGTFKDEHYGEKNLKRRTEKKKKKRKKMLFL